MNKGDKNSSEKESVVQKRIIDKIKQTYPGCIVLKNDANYIQGIPDLSVMYEDKWAMLEVKQNDNSSKRPNQKFYVNKANWMSFGRFISADNEDDILDELWEFMNS